MRKDNKRQIPERRKGEAKKNRGGMSVFIISPSVQVSYTLGFAIFPMKSQNER